MARLLDRPNDKGIFLPHSLPRLNSLSRNQPLPLPHPKIHNFDLPRPFRQIKPLIYLRHWQFAQMLQLRPMCRLAPFRRRERDGQPGILEELAEPLFGEKPGGVLGKEELVEFRDSEYWVGEAKSLGGGGSIFIGRIDGGGHILLCGT